MSNRVLNLVAGEALAGKEGVPAKVTGGKAFMCDAATDACIGVISRGGAINTEVEVTIFGDVGIVAAETVTRGEHATLDAAGESCDGGLADGAFVLGIFLQDGVAGDIVPAFVNAPMRYEEG